MILLNEMNKNSSNFGKTEWNEMSFHIMSVKNLYVLRSSDNPSAIINQVALLNAGCTVHVLIIWTCILPSSACQLRAWSTGTGTCTYSSTAFSVLSCTQYLAKIMSTSTRTYSSTEAKSTTEYFYFYFETVL